uniref:Uncharacterized protein n=1 Tax=Rhizophora mucronata TaxID=61149 RepID=A0A2P2J3U9_RHIMU
MPYSLDACSTAKFVIFFGNLSRVYFFLFMMFHNINCGMNICWT